MAHFNGSIVENMIRLIQRARTMDAEIAAVYLEPLLQLDNTFMKNEAANAVRDLVAALHESSRPRDEIWERALSTLYSWKNTLD